MDRDGVFSGAEGRGEVVGFDAGPFVVLANLLSVDAEGVLVVAGDDDLGGDLGRELEGAGEGHLFTDGTGAGGGPNPLAGDRGGRGCGAACDLGIDLSGGGSGDAPDGVDELLGGHALGDGAVEDEAVAFFRRGDGGALVDAGGGDESEGALEIVAGVGEVPGEVVEKVFAPGSVAHHVDGFDKAAAHEAGPQAVDDGAGEAAVAPGGREFGSAGEALVAGEGGVDGAEGIEEELGVHFFAGGFIAAEHLEGFSGEDGGHAVGVHEFPVVDEAIVTGGALHVFAEEDLGDVLRELDFGNLGGVDIAAPFDALDETLGSAGGVHEFADELIVGFVFGECLVEPAGDLLAASVDEAGAGVVVAQEVVPESHPVVGVVEFSHEEFGDFFATLIGRFGGEENCEFVLGGEEADEIEVGAAEEGCVGDGFGWLDAVLFKVGAEEAIDGILIGRDGCGQVGLAMSEGGLPFFFAEGEPGFPGEAFIDPLGEEGNLRGGERIGFVRHAFVGVLGGEDFDQDALIGVADLDGLGV